MSAATLDSIAAVLERITARLDAREAAQPVALKRSAAAKAMGVSSRKLEQLIVAGKVATAEDVRLVPMSEIRRYCAPKTKRQRRRLGGHRLRRTVDGQSDEAIAEMKRSLRKVR